MPAECNIGLKDFPDGILNDGKENPVKATSRIMPHSSWTCKMFPFKQILSVTLKAVTVKSGDTGEAFVRYPNSPS